MWFSPDSNSAALSAVAPDNRGGGVGVAGRVLVESECQAAELSLWDDASVLRPVTWLSSREPCRPVEPGCIHQDTQIHQRWLITDAQLDMPVLPYARLRGRRRP